MSDRIRYLLTTALVALVVGGLAGVTTSALAQVADPDAERVYEVTANADTVDGFSAIGATANKALRARKLVATNKYGQLPSNIIRPRWRELKGVPTGFKDGVDNVGVSRISITQVSRREVVGAYLEGVVDATCPAGSKVVGGGFELEDDRDMDVSLSRPQGDRQWLVIARNLTSGGIYLTAYAICLTTTPDWALLP